jgi:hypothetical protein
MNSAGSLLVKSFIVFYRDCYIPFHSLDFVRSHGAPKLLSQGPAPMPEFAETRFRLPEPVIPRKVILAIAPRWASPTTSSSRDWKGTTAERTGGGSYHSVYRAVEAGPATQNWCSSHDGHLSFSWKELPVSGRALPFVWASLGDLTVCDLRRTTFLRPSKPAVHFVERFFPCGSRGLPGFIRR